MMRKVFGLGVGGRHRNSYDANLFRALENDIRRNIARTYPHFTRFGVMLHAEDETRSFLYGMIRAEIDRTLEGVR